MKTYSNNIIVNLFIANFVFLIISLINIFQLIFSTEIIFYSRAFFFILLFIYFFISRIKNVYVTKSFFFISIFLLIDLLFKFNIDNKFILDFIILLCLSLIYFNLPAVTKIKIIKKTAFFYLYILFLFILLEKLGININSIYAYEGIDASNYVTSIGFNNANSFSLLLFSTFLMFIILKNFFFSFFSALLLLYTYKYTGTNSTYFSLFIVLFIYILYLFSKKSMNWVFTAMYYFFFFLFFLLFFNLNNIGEYIFGSLIPRYNDLLEFKNAINLDLSILFFGGISSNYDCYYTNLICGVGIIIFTLFIYYIFITLKKIIKYNDIVAYVCIFVMLIIGVIENNLFSTSPISIFIFSKIFDYEIIKSE